MNNAGGGPMGPMPGMGVNFQNMGQGNMMQNGPQLNQI
jgi:hypothetical protein